MKDFVEKHMKPYQAALLIFMLAGLVFAVVIGIAYCYYSCLLVRQLKQKRNAAKVAYYRRINSVEGAFEVCISGNEETRACSPPPNVTDEEPGPSTATAAPICPVCHKDIRPGDESVQLKQQRGVDNCNFHAKRRKLDHNFERGSKMHKKCREQLINPSLTTSYGCASPPKEPSGTSTRSQTRDPRSSSAFNFQTDCLFCGKHLLKWVLNNDGTRTLEFIDHHAKNRKDVSFVKTKAKFDQSLRYLLKDRLDALANIIRGRVQSVPCLRAADAVYHRSCHKSFLKGCDQKINDLTLERKVAFEKTVNYFENLTSELLITIEDLQVYMAQYSDPYSVKHIKRKMLKRFGDQIFIASMCGKKDVVVDSCSASDLIQQLYSKQRRGLSDEKFDIVKLAAKLICDDIRRLDYDPSTFFTLDDINVETQINVLPESLKMFLSGFKSRRSNADDRLIIATIGQCMINMAAKHNEPPLKVALGMKIFSMTGSAKVVSELHKCGLVCSPKQCHNFEKNAAVVSLDSKENSLQDSENALIAADNLDVNKVTLDGKGTFHGMGIILAHVSHSSFGDITIPKRKVDKDKILRNVVKIRPYSRAKKFQTIEGLEFSKKVAGWYCEKPRSSAIDYLRVSASILKGNIPQISGAMRVLCKDNAAPDVHTIEFLPIIDLVSTDMSCIFTTLNFVVDQHAKFGLPGKPILTFDQPLWQKAMIVNHHSELNVFIMLGNFHIQMSALAAIGYLMKNTGFVESIQTVFGENTANNIMKGKDYERAVRFHGLAASSLKAILLEQIDDEDDKLALTLAKDYFLSMMENNEESEYQSPEKTIAAEQILQIVKKHRENLSKSPTNALFFMYLDWYDAFLYNLHAERLGNWEDYVQSLKGLLPFMASAARRKYTKCIYWYLEEIEKLDEDTLATFKDGGFVIHRSREPYGAVSPDLACEQTLMAGIKGKTGLTRGRAFTELSHLTWVLSRPVVTKLNEKISAMTSTSVGGTIGQSSVKACRDSRIERDTDDVLKIKTFFNERFVFDQFVLSTKLRNVASGLIAPDSVNVQDAFSVGSKIIKALEGMNPVTAKIPKESLVKQFPSAAMINNKNKDQDALAIDPNLLFQRALSLSTSSEVEMTLERCLKFELSPYPMSIFDNSGFIRTNNKADLATHLLEKYGSSVDLDNDSAIVLDGGALLHRVQWEKGATFKEITDSYLRYLATNFASFDLLTVVFDGYQNSTKDSVHRKRQPIRGMEIQFNLETKLLCRKATLLSNTLNKTRFLKMLTDQLRYHNVKVVECKADADVTIVTTAVHQARLLDTTVVGDDTDLLVLLIHYVYQAGNSVRNVYLYRAASQSCFDIKCIIRKMPPHLVHCILAVHAASGCDTVSAIFGMGKKKLVKMCEKKGFADPGLMILYRSQGSFEQPDLLDAGLKLLISLYDNIGKHVSIDELRIWVYKKKLRGKTAISLKALPSTYAAATQHILRMYFQVQEWLGNDYLEADKYGWTIEDGEFYPTIGYKDFCPREILKIISCGCKDCTKKCTCKKFGMKCSDLCKCGDNCSFADERDEILEDITEEEEEDLDDEIR